MRVILITILFLSLIGGILLTAGCQRVPLQEDFENEYAEAVASIPKNFRVLSTNAIAHMKDRKPQLTLFLLVENPNSFPRSFKSMQVKIYDKQGRSLGYQNWTAQRSNFIIDANNKVPLAVSFPGVTEWQKVEISFSGLRSLQQEEVHRELKAWKGEPVKEKDNTRAAIAVQNDGSRTAKDIIILAAGYDIQGNIVAWGSGLRQWRTLQAGSTSNFEIDALQGDLSRIAVMEAYISAYN